jgi:hypothetical protein
MSLAEVLAMQGSGWDGDLDGMRDEAVVEVPSLTAYSAAPGGTTHCTA